MNEIAPKKSERLPIIGAVLAGGLASACCIGPLIVVLLGFGSASAFIAMEPYRPIFAVITLILLTWASWRHWQIRKQCTTDGCLPRKTFTLGIMGGLAILLLLLPSLLPWFFG